MLESQRRLIATLARQHCEDGGGCDLTSGYFVFASAAVVRAAKINALFLDPKLRCFFLPDRWDEGQRGRGHQELGIGVPLQGWTEKETAKLPFAPEGAALVCPKHAAERILLSFRASMIKGDGLDPGTWVKDTLGSPVSLACGSEFLMPFQQMKGHVRGAVPALPIKGLAKALIGMLEFNATRGLPPEVRWTNELRKLKATQEEQSELERLLRAARARTNHGGKQTPSLDALLAFAEPLFARQSNGRGSPAQAMAKAFFVWVELPRLAWRSHRSPKMELDAGHALQAFADLIALRVHRIKRRAQQALAREAEASRSGRRWKGKTFKRRKRK